MRATFRASGPLRAPFQGLSATLLRNAPANAIYLGSFEVFKQRAAASYGCEAKDLPALVVMGAGGAGGILYWLACFPGGSVGGVGWGGIQLNRFSFSGEDVFCSQQHARNLSLTHSLLPPAAAAAVLPRPTPPPHSAAAVDVIKSAMMTDSIHPQQRKYTNIATTARVGGWGRGGGGCGWGSGQTL